MPSIPSGFAPGACRALAFRHDDVRIPQLSGAMPHAHVEMHRTMPSRRGIANGETIAVKTPAGANCTCRSGSMGVVSRRAARCSFRSLINDCS